MWKLAWRNLWRRRSRTIIMVSAVALTTALMLISYGMGDSFHTQIEDTAVKTAGGSVVVQGKGYNESPQNDYVIADAAAQLEVLRGVSGIDALVPRITILGLLRSPTNATGLRILGVDLEAEAHLDDPRRFLAEGSFLEGEHNPLLGHPIVIGHALSKDLNVSLSEPEKLTLTYKDAHGEEQTELFQVVGVLKMGSASLERMTAYTTLEHASEIMRREDILSQIGVVISDDRQREAVRARVAEALTVGDIEVLTWDQIIPELLGFIEIDDAFAYIYAIVFFIVVAFGIVNTLLMAVLERTRELGLLSALGLAPGQIGRLIFYETLILAVLALGFGYLLGYGGHLYLHEVGIDLRELYGDNIDVAGVTVTETMLRSEVRPGKWIASAAMIFGLILCSALYPAWRATRLDPVEAMRTYE